MIILEDGERMSVRVPFTRYFMLIFFTGLAAVIYFLLLFSHIIAYILDDVEFRFEVLFSLLAAAIFFCYAMWFAFGTETIVFYPDAFEVIKSNKLFSVKKRYLVSDVRNLRIRERMYSINWGERIREKRKAFPFWIRMGRIHFDLPDRSVTILNGLPDDEAMEFLKLFKKQYPNLHLHPEALI